MEVWVHPPKQPRSRLTAPPPSGSQPSHFGPLVVAGAVVLVSGGIGTLWWIKTMVSRFIAEHPVAGTALMVLLYVLVLAVVAGAIAAVVIGVLHLHDRRGTVMPKEDGRVPVPIKTLRATGGDVAALRALQTTERVRAGRAIPEGVHTVTSLPPQGPVIDLLADSDPEPEPVNVRTFTELVRDGKVGPGRPLVIGFDDEGECVTGSWEDFYSMGVGGIPGSGKSNTAVHFMAQVLAAGGEVYLVDPNKGNRQSLSNRLGPMKDLLAANIAKSHSEVLELVKQFYGILQDRKRVDDERDRLGQPEMIWPPVLLVIDEFTILMKKEQQRIDLMEPAERKQAETQGLKAMLGDVNLEGRKYAAYALYLGQIWSAAVTGGGDMRDALGASIVHKSRQAQARMLSGALGAELPKDIFGLRKGECYVFTSTGEQWRVQIPLVDEKGVADLRKLVAAGSGGPPSRGPSRDLPGTFPKPALVVVPPASEGGREGGSEGALEKWADALDHTPGYLRALVWDYVDKGKTPAQVPVLIDPMASGGNRRQLAQRAIAEVMREGRVGEA